MKTVIIALTCLVGWKILASAFFIAPDAYDIKNAASRYAHMLMMEFPGQQCEKLYHQTILKQAQRDFEQCIDQINIDEESSCSLINNNLIRCSKPFIKKFQQCLPEESKNIPYLLTKGIDRAVSHICKMDGEHVFGLFSYCMFDKSNVTEECRREIEKKMDFSSLKKLPSTKEFCELVDSIKSCFFLNLVHSCDSKITRKSAMDVVDALSSPCNSLSNWLRK